MGRFKRKRRKILKTYTSPTTCKKDVTFIEVDKQEETKKVIKDFYNSLKKRNKFGNLIHDFTPLINNAEPTDTQMAMSVNNSLIRFLTIGDKFMIFMERRGLWSDVFNNYWGRLGLIESLLFSRKVRRTLSIQEGLEYFLHDELDKLGKNKTTIPNNLAFMARIALLFGVCGFLTIILLISFLCSPIIGFYYGIFSIILIIAFQSSIKLE